MRFRVTLMVAFVALLVGGAVFAQAVSPIRAIRTKEVLSAADLTLVEDSVPGAIAEIDAAVGLEARVTLYPGRPILSGQIGPPAMVERNQIVRMHFNEGPLVITTEGRVLDRAGVGEMVRVMNLQSRQIVSGTVGENGSIEVGP